MLSKSSFNALLKTLEEPPEHVKFLLATTDPQKLPVTVLSRCLQFNLKRMTPRLISERLTHICGAEEIDFEPAALALLARAADGSMRDALSLLDQAIAYCGGKIDEGQTATMLGTIDRDHVARIMNLLANGDAKGIVELIREIDEQFPDYSRLLDDIARDLQRVAVFQVVGASDSEDEYAEAEIADLAARIPTADVQLYYQVAIMGRRDLHLSPDPRSGVEMTLLRMLAFKPAAAETSGTAGGSVASKSSGPTQRAKSAAPVQVAPPAQAKQQVAPVQGQAWSEPQWSELVAKLNLTGAVGLLASNCAYLRRDGNTVFLALDPRSVAMLTKQRKDIIATALSEFFAEQLSVDITTAEAQEETPIQAESRMVDEKLEGARKELEADPNIQKLKTMFGAELKPDSIEILSGDKQ